MVGANTEAVQEMSAVGPTLRHTFLTSSLSIEANATLLQNTTLPRPPESLPRPPEIPQMIPPAPAQSQPSSPSSTQPVNPLLGRLIGDQEAVYMDVVQ